MRFIYLAGLVAALILTLWNIPPRFLSAEWAAYKLSWIGGAKYSDAPASKSVSIPELDLDKICPPDFDGWRTAHSIDGVEIVEVDDCMPDNPWDVAVSVRGTNNVSEHTLLKSLFTPDAIVKGADLDGDGDPDVIDLRLEVMELNGKSPDGPGVVPQFDIGPGISPGFWVFSPKTRGMATINFESPIANRMIRLPAPVIRIEQGDEVRITLENSHYMPHTIHFHGVDHPFKTSEGTGNDGVPMFSEHPVMPGQTRTYQLHPRHAGTAFYHCHVQPQSHILMGLQGMLVVEENRPNNWLQTFNIGAGRVRASSVAILESYDREFDLHYLEIDSALNNRIQQFNDPRLVSRAIHRGYNVTQRRPDYFVLNGRSFPYTLRESLVVVKPGQRNRIRVLNGGSEGLALHFHGHKPRLTHRDGVPLTAGQEIQRDVFWIASAQRLDLDLNTVNDGLNSYGAGAWLLHDHRGKAVTSNGIGPGGGLSIVAYEKFLGPSGLPLTIGGLQALAPLFSPKYYVGEVPVFTGMEGHQLSEPKIQILAENGDWYFWTGIFFLACILVIVPLLRYRA